ncbi:ent-kaurenoic acid oxidase-like [Rhodamnia argentea]|uniref:Ent-kaurenoic acid oxidase-like n=1 Tax=Rhodamnia argentea TaxID=178133 RepID=A0A8B8NHA5_9MYRT|nr:ent-kaurenoic acid oxidase-like [Rhodamnia argentea]
MGAWLGWILGLIPLLGWCLWWWNEIWYAWPANRRCSDAGMKLPPGHMGFPFFGEIFTFLWYFKIRRRPDEFINSKRRKYGDGVGMYRTHLFGRPSIISCFPSVNKFVFRAEDTFVNEWPNVDIVGMNALGTVQGKAHARLKSFILNAVNRPDALHRIAALAQPRLVAALELWAQKGRIVTYQEAKKVTFENIGKLFASFEPGPQLEKMDRLFDDMLKGMRAQAINFPGTAYHRAMQARKKVEEIFRGELEKRKSRSEETVTDLMDELRQVKDEEGKKLSHDEVLDNIVGFVFAGYESTSLASVWAIYYLAKSPNVLKKLREENMSISQNKKGEFITSEDISNMKYTKKVVEETLRMANISHFLFRLVKKDIDYKGYRIPKGWKVLLWLRYLHTNPENFDDPMCFNPDRWNESGKPEAYQVFGGGSRICPGNMLVRIQLSILLHHLSIGYKWELLNSDADFVYLPHPIPADQVEVSFSKL